jgi:signal transduction histidine kinase
LHERVFGVNEDASGNVWLETLKAGLYQYDPATGQLTHYDRAQGLPTQLYNRVAIISQGVVVCNEKGIYRFDAARQRFEPYSPFGPATATTTWLNDLVEDQAGDLWAVNGNKMGITLYRRQGNRFVAVPTPFRPVATSPINVVYPDQRGVVWFGGRDGLLRYDERVVKTYNQPFTALLRLVETVNGKVLYAGAATDSARARVTLPPKGNDISFDFAAATYPVTQELTFQYQLENYDAGWSEWSPASKKEYTNLPAGDYRFRVRARNVYGTVSREAQYAFTVGAPWYTHWWALGLLGLLGAGLLYRLVRWRLHVLVREKQSLESLIEQRTEEVTSQKAELENQSEELAVKNEQLEKIDLIVQSINAEVDFSQLFQNILAQFSIIRNMNSASFLVYHRDEQVFRYHALRANVDLTHVADACLTLEQAEERYLHNAVEIFEHIYLKKDVRFELLGNSADDLPEPKSLITIVMANQGQIEGFITLENTTRPDAFDQRDLSMISNLKEHLIAAFIKTRLLQNIEHTLHDLKETQGELVRQERLASVGQLTKGIADRILNPINYVKNFTESSNQILADVLDTVTAQRSAFAPDTYQNLLADLQDLRLNATTVLEHSNSTTRILSDMKRLLREKSREFLETDLNSFVDSRLRTAQQELKADYGELGVQVQMELCPTPLRVRLLPFELGEALQVILNNAYYAMQDKSRRAKGYVPVLTVSTSRLPDQAELHLRDNGKGIAASERAKLFSPFFTTKPTSKGTGLGLFMSKDIVEAHGGTIELFSQEGEFTELIIRLPLIS